MYNLLINLLLRHSVPVPFKTCISLVQFIQSHAFCQFMKQAHNSSSMTKVHSDIILSIPIAYLDPFPLLNPNWSSPSTSSMLSILLQTIHTTFAVCATRLIVQWSLHFVACGFFFKAIIVTSLKSLGYSPVSYMLFISCVISLRSSYPNSYSTSPGTSSPW
jgi:hypothetical protein